MCFIYILSKKIKFNFYIIQKPLLKNSGIGRLGYLSEPVKIKEAVEKLKTHFGMKTLRLALGNGKTLGI